VDVHAKKAEVGNLAVKVEVFARAEGFAKAKADPAQVADLRVLAALAKNHPANSENNHQAKSVAR